MKLQIKLKQLTLLFLITTAIAAFTTKQNAIDDQILAYTVDPKTQDLQLYWKDDKGEPLRSIWSLKEFVESKSKTLIFAMNGGMYMEDNSPLGLYIQNKQKLRPLNKKSGKGNFYLKPNGVFYITTDNNSVVCKTADFKDTGKIKYATQSGPMLVIDGEIHAIFKEGSTNLNIRNGVGVMPDGKVIFALSKSPINFYDFAKYFQNLGCKNALYLDGAVSRAFLPEKSWFDLDGNFGVMIGVTEKKN